MKKIYIAMLLSLMIATPALADNTRKAYIAVDAGRASFIPASGFDNPGLARIAGGYHFNPFISAEIAYTKFTDTTLTYSTGSATISYSSYQVAAVASYPLNPKFDLTAKLGVSNNSYTTSTTGGLTFTKPTSSITSLMYGVGVQYHMTSQFSVRAQYEDYGVVAEDATASSKLTAFSAGVMYNF